ncbi:MAG TPA: tryptophan 7-halogenase [Streptosporangiaceae bacterium]|nr:tryptophan 7-halogenase [Streptosporangiaceae bacterium]
MTEARERTYDVAIVGGGIGGSTLGAILARHGVRVLMLEGGSHPRFAIGESTIPESTLLLRVLAGRYGVPELAALSTFTATRRYVSSTCGVKRNFSFFHHARDEQADPRKSTQLSTFAPPLGPDCHFYRQDVDSWLYYLALRYGADGITNAQVTEVQFSGGGVDLGTADGRTYRARFLVDAGGIRALLPQALGLRETPCRYQTRSRSIFTHMVGVTPWEYAVPEKAPHGLPSPPSQGTLHHIFDGGWAWIIPFDNHPRSTNRLCSVGITLDLAKFPSSSAQPADEFWDVVSRYPSLAHQLQHARAARGFTGSRQNQFSSRQIAGDRWFLLPHASHFIDPLFSSGLSVTFWAINQLAAQLIDSVHNDHFSAECFEPTAEWIGRCFDYYDVLVSRSYATFGDFELWNSWNRVWILASLYSNSGLMGVLQRARGGLDDPAYATLGVTPYRGIQSIDNPEFYALFKAASGEVDRYSAGQQSASGAADRIYEHIAASGLTPSSIPLTDPGARSPAGTFTLLPLSRLRLWGLRAPRHVRGRYFNSGVTLTAKLLTEAIATELGQGASGVRHLIRDTFVGWNGDWRRPIASGGFPATADRSSEVGDTVTAEKAV